MRHIQDFVSKVFGSHFDYLSDSDRSCFPPPKPKLRFNIIGTGMIGIEHMRVTLLEGRATIKGIFDTNCKSRSYAQSVFQELRPGESLHIYDSLEETCMDPSIDALIICTPNYTHLQVLKVAMQSSLPILLEKPMATTLKDAYEIYQISKDYKSFIQVGLQYRYKAIYMDALSVLGQKSIGDLKTISITEQRIPFLDKVKQWNKFSEFSGGTLVEKCCHYFDLFNQFAQSQPIRIMGSGAQSVNFTDFTHEGKTSDILDNAFIIVEYENGIRASFSLCMFAPMFHEEVILCGSQGRYQAYETEDFLPGKRTKMGFSLHCSNGNPAKSGEIHHPEIIESSGHNGATFYEHKNFVDCIEEGITQSATVEDGFWSVLIAYAAEKAVETGLPVSVDALLSDLGFSDF